MQNTRRLSVTIITLNEADRIRQCLESVKDLADEIIVFDSGSTDETLEIVKQYTDKIWQTDWPGFGKQKQRALEQASGDWVLSIDADEAIDVELQRWIKQFLASPDSNDVNGVVAAKMQWGVTLYGKRLDYGRSARSPLRLVRREGARFSDVEVHEKILHGPGKVVQAKGRLLHYTHRDYGHALGKNIDYAWLGSQKYFRQGKRTRSLTLALLRSMWTFILIYFIRGGFLDGPVGFLMAMAYAQNNFNKYAGLWTLTREEDRKAKES